MFVRSETRCTPAGGVEWQLHGIWLRQDQGVGAVCSARGYGYVLCCAVDTRPSICRQCDVQVLRYPTLQVPSSPPNLNTLHARPPPPQYPHPYPIDSGAVRCAAVRCAALRFAALVPLETRWRWNSLSHSLPRHHHRSLHPSIAPCQARLLRCVAYDVPFMLDSTRPSSHSTRQTQPSRLASSSLWLPT